MDEDMDSDKFSRPLQHVVLCCTSIPPEHRTELASRASEMGAKHTLDLTSEVTHLLVGDPDTPKYKYVAKHRPDVAVLSPDWIDAVREQWLEGGETDIAALEEKYRLPTFAGLRVCLTGFDDPVQRQEMREVLTANGAEYYGDLTKEVTHLIAYRSQGAKYNFAMKLGMRVVAPEWLADSVERRMVLDESLYSLLLPREERGRGAWIRSVSQQGLINGAAGPAGAAAADRSTTAEAKRTRKKKNRIPPHETPEGIQKMDELWDMVCSGGLTRDQREQEQKERETVKGQEYEAQEKKQPKKNGVFQDCEIFISGFEDLKASLLKDHLKANDAKIISPYRLSLLVKRVVAEGQSNTDTTTKNTTTNTTTSSSFSKPYVIVPHASPTTSLPEVCLAESVTTATEWWVERCLYYKRIVDPTKDFLCRPLPFGPVDGLDKIQVSSTGLDSVDLLHVGKLVKLLGATYQDELSPEVSVLVASARPERPDKAVHAKKWGIPTVALDWLRDCALSGERKPVASYLISPIVSSLR